MPATKKQEILDAIKEIVKQINRYGIDDEESIIFLFQRRIKLSKEKFTNTEAKLVLELIKNPKISNREIAKRYNLSEVWISRTKNRLIKERVIIPTFMIDPHSLGLAHKIVLLSTFPNMNKLLISMLSSNPYVVQISKVFGVIISETKQFYYLVSLFVPTRDKKAFDNWFSSLYRYKFIKDFASIDIQRFEHSANIEIFKEGKWFFDGVRDAFLSWDFLKRNMDILPSPKSFVTLNYAHSLAKNKINSAYLALLSELLKDPFLPLSKLQNILLSKKIRISKKRIKNLRKSLLSKGILYFKIRHSDLDNRISLFMWEPFIQKEVYELFRKYIENYPQSEVYASVDGIYATLEFPSAFYRDVRFSLERVKKKFDNLLVLDFRVDLFERHFADIVSLWNSNADYWIFNDSMLPNLKEIMRAVS